MKLGKISLLSFILVFLTAYMSLAENKDLIYVLDVSGSMKKGDLHRKVQTALVDHIKEYFSPSDGLYLFSFADGISIEASEKQATDAQRKELLIAIERLQFSGDWTYMTKAFDIVSKRVRELQEDALERPIYIYFFTDGKNDPPPDIKNPLTFDQIMKWYFDIYDKDIYTFLYVVTFDTEPDPGVKEFVDKLREKDPEKARIETRPREPFKPPEPKLPSIILVEPSSLSFTMTTRADSGSEKFKLKFENQTSFDNIPVSLSIKDAEPGAIQLSPDQDTILKDKQKKEYSLTYYGLTYGEHKFRILPSTSLEGIRFKPAQIEATLRIKKPLPSWVYLVITLLLAAVVIAVIKCLSTPKFPRRSYLLQVDDSGNELGRSNLLRRQKLCRKSISFSGDVRVPGLGQDTFRLIAKRDGVYIKSRQSLTLVELDEIKKAGELFRLASGTEFIVGGNKFRYQIE